MRKLIRAYVLKRILIIRKLGHEEPKLQVYQDSLSFDIEILRFKKI